MNRCGDCVHYTICSPYTSPEETFPEMEGGCKVFKNKADFVEVVRCRDCIHAEELDKHCELNGKHYKNCRICRGDETRNVWHKYKKYYRDYSLVEVDGYCSDGERNANE